MPELPEIVIKPFSPTSILLPAYRETQDIVEATFRFRNSPRPPLIRLLEFILTVEIAGSSAQSAILDRLEVVARGMPFKRSSVPTVVKTDPSNTTATVEIVLMNASSASKNIVDTEPAFISSIFAVACTSKVDVIVLTAYTVEKVGSGSLLPPRPDKGRPKVAYVS